MTMDVITSMHVHTLSYQDQDDKGRMIVKGKFHDGLGMFGMSVTVVLSFTKYFRR
jgi:hypothetical protein